MAADAFRKERVELPQMRFVLNSSAQEFDMADTARSNNGFLYFIVGALLVAVVVLGILYYNGSLGGAPASSPTERAVDRAADAVERSTDRLADSAERAAQPQ